MWDRRGGSITRVADTLVISVSQPAEPMPWGDVASSSDCGHGAELRNHDCPSPMLGAGSSGTDSLNASGTWLSAGCDSVADLGSEDISLRAEDTFSTAPATLPAAAATAGDDGIQIICRFDYESRRPTPPSSPPPYPPPPPPTESPPVLAALSRDVSEFSSIIEIDGDSFCIRSRLAGREEPEEASSKSSPGGGEDSRQHGDDDSDSDGDESEDETSVLVAQCRRFYQSRLVSRWPALMPEIEDDITSVREDTVLEEEEEDEEDRPTSVDSGRESGTDSRSAEEDGVPPPLPTLQGPPVEKAQTPLEAKMALLRREVSSLMRRDNELFRQLLSIHDSIEALKHGDGSLSAGSSLCSLAGIEEEEEEREEEEEEEEEDTISTPSTDLDRQSRLSAETDTFSLVKGDSGSERSFFSEILHVTGMSQWAKSRLAGPASLTPDQMAPPSIRQAAPPPLSPVAEKGPVRRHRKQGSCDSGIVDQEIRSQA